MHNVMIDVCVTCGRDASYLKSFLKDSDKNCSEFLYIRAPRWVLTILLKYFFSIENILGNSGEESASVTSIFGEWYIFQKVKFSRILWAYGARP